MEIDDIKSRLTVSDTIRLLEHYGAEVYQETNEYYVFNSICHSSESHKLYLYKTTNTLHCFVCGAIDIISIVENLEGLSFQEAINFIIDFFQLDKIKKGFGRSNYIIKHEKKEIIQKKIDITEKLPEYNESILNTFKHYKYPIEFLKENISKEIMDLFEIGLDINTESVTIPVRDADNRLIGVRIRNLNEELTEKLGKYIPYRDVNGTQYNFPTGRVLYGLNINKEKIKESKKIIIFEGEKSVLKSKTYFGVNDISVASFGCSLSNFQIEIIRSLGVEDIYIMYDREEGDDKITEKYNKLYKKLNLFFNVYYIEDYEDLIKEKDSPVDRGEDIYRKLLGNVVKYNEQ